jgi:cell wall-associated NlpC family hydrolase
MKQPALKDFRRFIGVPFVSGGRDPRIGLDCWGLFMAVHALYGRKIPDVDVACTELLAINRAAQVQIRALWKRVTVPESGVSVVMATDHAHPNIIQHFGVLLDRRNIIHCIQKTGVVIDDLYLLESALCIKGLYAWNGD